MKSRITINKIPVLVWGAPSDKVYIHVHGKMSDKQSAEKFAEIAESKGYQTLSFDLPGHGERAAEGERCDIWNGMRDLALIEQYASKNWKEISLYACSLGAYFSLNTYAECKIKKCLFQAPIVDMEYLIRQMMLWFDVSEERLSKELEVDTPIDVLSWKYCQYVKSHPVCKWNVPTNILYGGKDDLQSLEVMKGFADRFGCELTVAEDSVHSFGGEKDGQIVEQWLREQI